MKLPTLDRLSRDVGSTYLLLGSWGCQVSAELRSASPGVPMNKRHCCYAAEFALPPGVQLPQSSCTLIAGDDTWSGLLLTPIGPDEDGRQLMQTVLHYPIPQASPLPGPGA